MARLVYPSPLCASTLTAIVAASHVGNTGHISSCVSTKIVPRARARASPSSCAVEMDFAGTETRASSLYKSFMARRFYRSLSREFLITGTRSRNNPRKSHVYSLRSPDIPSQLSTRRPFFSLFLAFTVDRTLKNIHRSVGRADQRTPRCTGSREAYLNG